MEPTPLYFEVLRT